MLSLMWSPAAVTAIVAQHPQGQKSSGSETVTPVVSLLGVWAAPFDLGGHDSGSLRKGEDAS